MHDGQSRRAAWEVLAASIGMCAFALFAHAGLPAAVISGLGLVLTAFVLYRFFESAPAPSAVLGLSPFRPKAAAFLPLGAALGAGFGIALRLHAGWGALPASLKWFAFPAALIGAAEEILYRGYVQGRARSLGAPGAAFFAALAHTAYKCSLFVLAPVPIRIDLAFLAIWTFAAGLLLGALREITRSVFPSVVGHACFDLIVYGARAQAPWWVWS